MTAQSMLAGGATMWQEIPTRQAPKPLDQLVSEHSAALAVARAQALYPWVEPDRVGAKMRAARQYHSAGKHRLAAEIVRDFERYAERVRPTEQPKTVRPWLYGAVSVALSAGVIFGGWVIW